MTMIDIRNGQEAQLTRLSEKRTTYSMSGTQGTLKVANFAIRSTEWAKISDLGLPKGQETMSNVRCGHLLGTARLVFAADRRD